MPQLIIVPLTTFFSGLGLGAIGAGIAANLTASLLFSVASRAFQGRGRGSDQQAQSDMVRSLSYPTSIPPKRTVYGVSRVPGSGAPGWVVKNGILYCCFILNSRPSDGGGVNIYLDKRAVTLTGNLFDFATGASASNSPFAGYAKFWLGLGDQSGPPAQIMSEVGDATATDDSKFWPTDRWSGRTVLWARFDRGPQESRAERWPSAPPQVEVMAQWSKVWDPRDPAQAALDPETWTYSANQALCLLDAIRNNPIRQRDLRQIDIGTMIYAADVADSPRALQAGGIEPSWKTNGLIVWASGELMDQLAPLVQAGGGFLFQSGGRIGYAPAAYRASSAAIGDVLRGQPIAFTRSVPSRDLPRAVRGRFVDPAAQWEMSDLVPYPVPGAGGFDGDDDGVETLDLALVTSATQAMQLQKIKAELAARQKRLSCELPPENFNLIAGSNVNVDFPRESDRRNGQYMLTQTKPAAWLQSEDGVAFRIPVEMREISADIWSWSPSEETEVIVSAFSPINLALAAPTDLDAAAGTGQVDFDFDGSGSDAVEFEWQWRRNSGDWVAGGFIDSTLLNGLGRVYGVLLTATAGSYDFRVRGLRDGRTSGWVASVSPAIIALDLGVPTGGAAVGGRGRIDFSFNSPNSVDFKAMEIYAGSSSTIGAASQLVAPVYGAANTTFDFAETGLGAAQSRYYFARSVGPSGALGGFTAALAAVTAPLRYVMDFASADYKIDGAVVTLSAALGLTRATTATYIDSAGTVQVAAVDTPRFDYLTGARNLLIEAAGGNAWTYSEDLTQSVWLKAGATVTSNVTAAPDGLTTADKLVEDTAAATFHYLRRGHTFTNAVQSDFVLHAKAGERNVIRVRCFGTGLTTQAADVNLTTGAVTVLFGSPLVSTYALAGGWWRIECGFIPDASVAGFLHIMLNNGSTIYSGDGASGAYFWGIQDGGGSYCPTTTAAVTRAADVPTMQGVTDTLDLLATYSDGTTTAIAASVSPGYWPALTKKRISSLISD